MYRMGFYALIPVRRELRDLRICRFQYERYTVIYPPLPLPVCTTNMKKLPLVGIRNFSTQNNSIIKKRLANSSHLIMGMVVQAFAELQILLKSLLHKRKRSEITLLTAKDTPFVSLTGCHPDSRTLVFLSSVWLFTVLYFAAGSSGSRAYRCRNPFWFLTYLA